VEELESLCARGKPCSSDDANDMREDSELYYNDITTSTYDHMPKWRYH